MDSKCTTQLTEDTESIRGNMKLTHNYTSTYQNNMDSANKNKDRHPERFVQMVVAVM